MIVILAGVTMNALFAWLLFTLPGRQERPPDRSGDDGRPGGGRAGAAGGRGVQADPARDPDRARSTARPVASWDEIAQGIANTPEPEIRLELADGSMVTAPIHPDALEQRLKAVAGAAAVSGRRWWARWCRAAPPPAPASSRATPSPPSTGSRSTQWYDLLELLQKSAGAAARGRGGPGGRPAALRDHAVRGLDHRARREAAGDRPDRRGRGGDFRSEPLQPGPGGGRGLARHGRAPRPRSCAPCGASSAGGSPSGRSAARS